MGGRGLYRDQAIVLRTWKLGESDRIASLLTVGNGKLRAVAKGARKARSRFGSRVEPGAHLAVQLYAGRGELDTLTQTQALDPMSAIRGDLHRLGRAAVLLEVAEQACIDRQANPTLFHLLLGALRTLERADSPLVVAGFLLKLLLAEGVQPDLDHCLGCGATEGFVTFDAAGGGVRCGRCRLGQALPSGSVEVMAAILGGQLRTVLSMEEGTVTRAVEQAAIAAVEHHLERRVRAASFHLDETVGPLLDAIRRPAAMPTPIPMPTPMGRGGAGGADEPAGQAREIGPQAPAS